MTSRGACRAAGCPIAGNQAGGGVSWYHGGGVKGEDSPSVSEDGPVVGPDPGCLSPHSRRAKAALRRWPAFHPSAVAICCKCCRTVRRSASSRGPRRSITFGADSDSTSCQKSSSVSLTQQF